MIGTIEATMLVKGVKYAGICLFVWFIQPIFNLFIVGVDTVAILTPYAKAVLADLTSIMAFLVPFVLLAKYIYEIVKMSKGKTKK